MTAPNAILQAAPRFTLVTTPDILAEYRRVTEDRAARTSGVDASPILALVTLHSEIIDHPPLVTQHRDPHDDKFLACAAASLAIVVSEDKDLLGANGVLDVQVLTSRAFEALLTAEE